MDYSKHTESNAKVKIPEVPFFQFVKHSLNILRNPLPFHHENFEKKGDIFRLNIGFGNSVVFSRNADLLRYALQKNQKNYKKSKIQTEDLSKYIGFGLLTSESELWQKQRKLIQPAFHKHQLEKLLEKIHQAIESELSKIDCDKPIDIFPIFNDLAFQTVVKALFSSEATDVEIKRLQEITEQNQEMLVKELRQPYLKWWFVLSGKIKKHINYTNEARVVLKAIVERRKKSGREHNDLLDMLLEAQYEDGTSMSEKQLLDEILILFVAGHETTSNALCFVCELLARNPEAQVKIVKEMQQIKAFSTDYLEWIKQSTYTKCVIEEAMRLYPPAYFIDRVNKEDDAFEGINIPKETNLLFSIYEIHRHPDYWENPLQFLPERFMQNKLEYSKYYFPFGAGQRMCIGNNFAMYEMILAVLELMRRFEILEKKTPIKIKPLITLKPLESVLQFKARA